MNSIKLGSIDILPSSEKIRRPEALLPTSRGLSAGSSDVDRAMDPANKSRDVGVGAVGMKCQHVLFSLIMLSSVLLSGCSKVDDLVLGKDNTQKPAPLVNFQASVNMQRLWVTSTGGGSKGNNLKILPAIEGNKIYTVDTKGTVVAVDKDSGKVLWKTALKASIVSGPSVGSTYLAVASSNAQVIMLDNTTGKKLWVKGVSNQVLAPPAIADGRIYVKTVDGNLYAFEAQTGHKLWKYEHSSPGLILRTGSSPQVSGRLVIVGFSDGKLDGLDGASGSLQWERDIAIPEGSSDVERMVDIDANPIIANGVVYVATYHGYVVAMSLADGQVLWRHKISTYSGMALTPSFLVIADSHSYLWAFDRKSGGVIWRQKQLAARGLTAPAVYGKYIVIADAEGVLHWLDASDGHFVARATVGSAAIYAAPLVVDNKVYVLNSAGNLAAYTASK